jgi:hypothetical protein
LHPAETCSSWRRQKTLVRPVLFGGLWWEVTVRLTGVAAGIVFEPCQCLDVVCAHENHVCSPLCGCASPLTCSIPLRGSHVVRLCCIQMSTVLPAAMGRMQMQSELHPRESVSLRRHGARMRSGYVICHQWSFDAIQPLLTTGARLVHGLLPA